jgi:hypothetical protein
VPDVSVPEEERKEGKGEKGTRKRMTFRDVITVLTVVVVAVVGGRQEQYLGDGEALGRRLVASVNG